MNGIHLKGVIFSVCDSHVSLFFSLFSLSLSLPMYASMCLSAQTSKSRYEEKRKLDDERVNVE